MNEFVEAAPKWIGVGSFAVLVMTVVHEFGYFSVLGPHFQTFLSSYDYFTNALVWLPSTTAILTYLQVMEGVLKKPVDGPVKVFGTAFYIQLAIAVTFLVVDFILGAPLVFPLTGIFGFLSVWVMSLILPTKKYEHRWGLYKTLAMTPMVLIFAFGYGASSANSDLIKTDDVYIVKLRDGNAPTPYVMLRGFEKGVLVRNYAAETVELISWKEITSLSRVAPRPASITRACAWLGVLCFGKVPVIPHQ